MKDLKDVDLRDIILLIVAMISFTLFYFFFGKISNRIDGSLLTIIIQTMLMIVVATVFDLRPKTEGILMVIIFLISFLVFYYTVVNVPLIKY